MKYKERSKIVKYSLIFLSLSPYYLYMMPIVYILVLIALLLAYFIYVFNKLVKSRNIKREAWSGVDVQLKQRHELVPNLINLVKGYAEHEKKLLQEDKEVIK